MQPSGNEYLSQAVLTASPMELIRMLYEGGLAAVEVAMSKLRGGDIMGRGTEITKAMNIVQALRARLDGLSAEQRQKLDDLYAYMQTRLLKAHIQASEEPLQEVARVFRSLVEGSRAAVGSLKAGIQAPEPHPRATDSSEDSRSCAYIAAACGAEYTARHWQA